MNDHRHQGGERFAIEIVALADDCAPPIIRLRRVLKSLLRVYGFRCTSARDMTPPLPPLPSKNADGSGGTDDR